MKTLKIIFSFVYWIVISILIVFGALIALSVFKIPGGISLFVVQSGSMEPTIKIGSVVFVQKMDNYSKNDIVTFLSKNSKNKKDTTTHRIIATKNTKEGQIFATKGDANRGVDREILKRDQVLGKVTIDVPYLGYVVSFARTQLGFIVLIVIPGVIIVFSEILNIKREVLKIFRKKNVRKEVLITILLLSSLLMVSGSTKAYLFDEEKLTSNTIQTGSWTNLTPTPTPSGNTIIISGNGEGSQNSVDVEDSTDNETIQENDTTIINNINSTSNTGNNRSDGNIESGKANSNVNISTQIENNH